MAKDTLLIGPVLSFRGIGDGGKWKVSVLIGVSLKSAAPVLQLAGIDCQPPVELAATAKVRILRYDLTCQMAAQERRVEYRIKDASFFWHFTVPGRGYAPRMAYVSCNGFSSTDGIRKLVRPQDDAWEDLISNHDSSWRRPDYKLDKEQIWHEQRTHAKGLQRFHLLIMGGDQIYFDSIWHDIPALEAWISLSRKEQLKFPVSKSLDEKIRNYYFNLYADRWLSEKRSAWGLKGEERDAALAMSLIPTVMMWDDHDIFDGWGSYSPEMQQSPLFQTIFRYARQAFWVFQLQQRLQDLPELEPVAVANVRQDDPILKPIQWSLVQAADPLSLPFLDKQPGFTSIFRLYQVLLIAADLRTERSRTQILGSATWSELQRTLREFKPDPIDSEARCQHALFMSSVPVAHPKLSLAEELLDAYDNEHVLDSNADDLKDHWAHDDHEGERKRLLETLISAARSHSMRISILSGDVHLAGWGVVSRRDAPVTENVSQIQQFTSSAIVHPSLIGVFERLFLSYLNNAADGPQSIDNQHNVEMMVFPNHKRYFMPARNWLALELDMGEGNLKNATLWATWRCERETGFSNHLVAVHAAKLS